MCGSLLEVGGRDSGRDFFGFDFLEGDDRWSDCGDDWNGDPSDNDMG